MNDDKYINPSSKLLKEIAKLSYNELIVISKNYKKIIDNIKYKTEQNSNKYCFGCDKIIQNDNKYCIGCECQFNNI
jgi:hypothetical protein